MWSRICHLTNVQTSEYSKKATAMKCLVLNTQSIVSKNKTGVGNETTWNLHRFLDFVYSETTDVVFVSESWLISNIMDSELLCQDYAIFCRDRVDRRGGEVLIVVKSSLFKSVKHLKSPAS